MGDDLSIDATELEATLREWTELEADRARGPKTVWVYERRWYAGATRVFATKEMALGYLEVSRQRFAEKFAGTGAPRIEFVFDDENFERREAFPRGYYAIKVIEPCSHDDSPECWHTIAMVRELDVQR